MAILNVLVEILRGNWLFQYRHIFYISFYYAVFGIISGLILGILISFYFFIMRKKSNLSLPVLTYIFLFFATMLLIFGYINFFYLPLFGSFKSIFWNLVITICGLSLYIIIKKYSQFNTLNLIFRIHVILVVCILLSSLIVNILQPSTLESLRLIDTEQEGGQYNVILISLDAVRSDHLGCYGYPRNTSPYIDRLASRALLFTNAFSTSSQTLESVPSLFTATYPVTHRVRTFANALPERILTMPQIFKLFGYKTALFSSIGVVSESFGYGRGIDDYSGPETHLIYHTILFFTIKKFSLLKIPILDTLSKGSLRLFSVLVSFKYTTPPSDPNLIRQNLASWINAHKDERFFIYVHFQGGHAPYKPPYPYSRLFDPEYPHDPITKSPKGTGLFLPFVEGTALQERDIKNLIAQYDGEIFYHDENIGMLLDHIKKLGLDRNTIIVITADHGEEFYEHRGWEHGHSLFDEVIHIPLIVYVPGIIKNARTIDALVSSVDIMPTLLGLCGIAARFSFPYKIAGVDLSPDIVSGNHIQSRKFILAEVYQGGHQARCYRTNRYKAIQAEYGKKIEHMVFDLEADPQEQDNIYEQEKEISNDLFAQMESAVKEAEKLSFRPRQTIVDEKLKELLKSLGYLK
jgi:arylsulfatase A-like enzyme